MNVLFKNQAKETFNKNTIDLNL